MDSRAFGGTGRDVSVIGQGTWRVRSVKGAAEALEAGLDAGLTHVDTAELYEMQSGSESMIGKVLAERDREEVFLASKVLPRNASYEGTLKACEASLKRLRTSYLDLYYLHWWSDAHPVAETMRAMERLVDEGKIRAIGVSNFDVEELEEAAAALSKHDIRANQVLYNLEDRAPEARLIPRCRERGIAFVAYSPFGAEGGFPSASSRGGRALAEVAERHGATPRQVALNFLARDPAVFPIPKAEKVEHVEDNAGALAFTLTDEDVRAIERAFPRPAGSEIRIT